MATLAYVRRIPQGYSVVWGEKNVAKVRNFLGGVGAEQAHTFLASLNAHKIESYGNDALAGVYSVPSQRQEQTA